MVIFWFMCDKFSLSLLSVINGEVQTALSKKVLVEEKKAEVKEMSLPK